MEWSEVLEERRSSGRSRFPSAMALSRKRIDTEKWTGEKGGEWNGRVRWEWMWIWRPKHKPERVLGFRDDNCCREMRESGTGDGEEKAEGLGGH